MGSNDENVGTSSTHYAEMVVRTLRHEVGDLLQSVYSAVAILQERLPRGQSLERTILSDLRGRAEACKNELDAAHDLVCPITPNLDWVELGELVGGIAASYSLRYPSLQIICEVPRLTRVWGDAPRLAQATTLLLMSLCPAARSKVVIRAVAEPASRTVEWSFTHDGPPANDEQLNWLKAAFSTTRHARFGIGLAFARRVVELLGGQIKTGESSEGGFQIILVLPSVQPKE
jgi:signal transduction histidine kinase